MLATESELEAIEELSKLDTEIIRAQKKLEELPQRQAILTVRQKLAEVTKKKTQVQDMIDTAEDELSSLITEDEKLEKKQAEIQQALDRVKGDYRSVESYTKDLHGVTKRREKLNGEIDRVDKQVGKTKPVMDQIMAACSELESREKDLIDSFKQEGGALQNTLAQANTKRQAYLNALNPELVKAYERACHECGGLGVALLQDSACSACRAVFDSSKLNKIKQEQPVSHCPSCRRLLLVKD